MSDEITRRIADALAYDRALLLFDDPYFVDWAKSGLEVRDPESGTVNALPGIRIMLPAPGEAPGANGPGVWFIHLTCDKGALPEIPAGVRVVYDVDAPGNLVFVTPPSLTAVSDPYEAGALYPSAADD